jgi:hypothetical protein
VQRTQGRRSRLRVAFAALALGSAACSADIAPEPDAAPWDEPVPGAVAVTEWRDDGQPASPFGPGGAHAWRSPDELVSAMAQALATSGDARATGRVVERRASGTAIGWVRIDLDAGRGPALAGDLRMEMRNDGGAWVVTNLRSREHCGRELVGGECE